MTSIAEQQARAGLSPLARLRGWLRNPWGKPRFFVIITWAYILWSIVPVLIAVQFSFNATRSRTTWDSSTRWYWGDPVDSVWNDPTLRHALVQSFKLAGADVLIAVPIGVLLALGPQQWHGRLGASSSTASSTSSRPRSHGRLVPPRLHEHLHVRPHRDARASLGT